LILTQHHSQRQREFPMSSMECRMMKEDLIHSPKENTLAAESTTSCGQKVIVIGHDRV
jgi:hypothetical protein